MDGRSSNQFKKDMLLMHKNEAEIAVRICIYLKSLYKKWPTIVPNGTDYRGKVVKKAHSGADYIIDGIHFEITHSNKVCPKYFHEKTNKVERCIDGEYFVVFTNGLRADRKPRTCIITPPEMKRFAKIAKKRYGLVKMPAISTGIVNKEAYRFDIDCIDTWFELPELTKEACKVYKEILDG